ncbi:DNA-3-methyladenine glycosylase 2 family protein [Thiomonas bhubaneswarensis]|uniref:DNA-3-methyladenine glycosylase II n=1 Tax=Thiomonas bhubaneswarensis TaxID=339866 RepID=A0A0K6HT82_9BURK|nr:Ada metal-binding domain-containing protein [Thiomonas bhubaneswarensis]CUA94242.1 DNA-3-methyladenine glycosylase II [Thiomonas bhubaneswarensis]
MELDPDACYSALLTRDRRFDGWFFVGVASTGVYCRPVCAVRTPLKRNCSFYLSAAAAEQAGFRPCLRCRPELAPGHGVLDLSGQLARAAAALIDQGLSDRDGLGVVAGRVGVTPRHLRRIFETEFGVSPVAYAQTQRLLLAKRLLTDTALPMAEVAGAAGFGSVRRFNHLFRSRYGLTPLRLRKAGSASTGDDLLTLSLAYRPPYAWAPLIDFLARRAVDGVEHITADRYCRAVAFAGAPGAKPVTGWITVSCERPQGRLADPLPEGNKARGSKLPCGSLDGAESERLASREVDKELGAARRFLEPERHSLRLTLPPRLSPHIGRILAGVRRLFDLGARPDLIDTHLPEFAAEVPGLRVPGALNGFEIALRAVVGQQIGLPQARAILARLAQQHGTPVPDAPHGLCRTLPDAPTLAACTPEALQACGLTRARAHSLHALALAVTSGRVTLQPLAPVEPTLAALRALPGIGDWTAQMIALRGLGWPNAFPAADLVLRKQLGLSRPDDVLAHAARWAPWRGYAAMHLWRRAAQGEPECIRTM